MSGEEAQLLKEGAVRDFLTALEVTPMSRSYKMLVLRVMLDQGVILDRISIDSLVAGVQRLAQGSPRIHRDLDNAAEGEELLRELLVSNPIKAWVDGKGTGGKPYFSYHQDWFALADTGKDGDTERFGLSFYPPKRSQSDHTARTGYRVTLSKIMEINRERS